MKKLLLILCLTSILFADKIIVGKFERITFNEFGLNDIRAKIDTGARTSSIHCSVIHPISNNRIAFILLDEDHKKFTPKTHIAKISRIANVKSSNGKVQKRYFIKTDVTFLGKNYHTEFSLSNRENMKFPVLVGRSLLKQDFLVDVTKEYSYKTK